MKCTFQWIQPHEIGDYWQTIKHGLVETAEKAPGGWTPHDVFMQLVHGQATLHLVLVDKYYRGFMVTKMIDAHEGKKLLLWILHGDMSGDVMRDNKDQFGEWAKACGAVKIQFQSNRKGWERVVKQVGFEPTMIIYESEV